MAKGGKRPKKKHCTPKPFMKPLPSLVKAVVEQDVCAGLLRMNLMDELLPPSIDRNPYLTPTDLPLARTTIILQWKNLSNSSLLLNLASSHHPQHIFPIHQFNNRLCTFPKKNQKTSRFRGPTSIFDHGPRHLHIICGFRRRKVTPFQYGLAPEAHQERK